MEEVFNWMGTDAGGLFIWGAFARLLGVAYVIALLPFAIQLPALAGRVGLTPFQPMLKAYWRDFGIKALWKYPTLYWLTLPLDAITAELCLVALPLIATTCAIALTLGVGYTPYLIAVCWATLVSIDNGASALMFPWDSFLLESSFLALFLPSLPRLLAAENFSQAQLAISTCAHALWNGTGSTGCPEAGVNISMSSLPNPLLSFAFRYVLVRVLVGFGKIKFMGTTGKDRLYIKYFLINQPIVTPAGWLMYHTLPHIVWIFSIIAMFVVEIPLPFLAFVPGWWRVSASVSIIVLMFGIMVCGNFGYFNVLTIVMCIPLLHHSTTVFETSLDMFTVFSKDAVFGWIYVAFIFPASLLVFVLGNSWVNLSWFYWPALRRLQPAFLWNYFVTYIRTLAPLRLVQTYGVFPPNSAPPQRWIVQYEVSDDAGASWQALSLPHVSYAPTLLAPYHARVDHAIFYESLGMNGANMMGLLVHPDPLHFSFTSGTIRPCVYISLSHSTSSLYCARLCSMDPRSIADG
jgi:hypothetical protein